MDHEAIENVLYANACERLTARQTKEELRKLGAEVDLRCWSANEIDVFDAVGSFQFTAAI